MKLKLWKKEEKIIGKIEAFLDQIDTCRDLFVDTMKMLVERPEDVTETQIADVHRTEARADDLRREIELQLYEKALIPESRGDVLGLIESADVIPNAFEDVVSDMHIQHISVPEEFREQFLELVRVNVAASNVMSDAIRDFFYHRRDSLENLSHIDERESQSDRIQRELIGAIFSADMDTGEKILLRDLVNGIGSISDGAEKCADRLTLAVIKRRP